MVNSFILKISQSLCRKISSSYNYTHIPGSRDDVATLKNETEKIYKMCLYMCMYYTSCVCT